MPAPSTTHHSPPTAFPWKATAALFVSFLLFAAVRSPIPGINEPHYLAKAKHFWNPEWCPGDFFLESSNAHYVFYYTLGTLTQWLSLEQTAWIGRILGLLLLSIGWTKLVSNILPGKWSALKTGWVFLLLAAVGSATRRAFGPDLEFYAFNLSGEWIIGGTEGKVFAYGLLLWGLSLGTEQRWNRAAVCFGLAISFHPVVGVWGVLCVLFALLMTQRASRGFHFQTLTTSTLLLTLCALPGLIPALQFLGGGDPQLATQAEFIQVFERLAHHLDPMRFKIGDYVSLLFLIAFWLSARNHIQRSRTPEQFFRWFVVGTIGIAFVGLLIGLRTGHPQDMVFSVLRTKMLKFYPFRPCDVFVPLAASIALVGLLRNWSTEGSYTDSGMPTQHGYWLDRPIFCLVILTALVLPSPDRTSSRMRSQQQSDWQDICHWIAAHTQHASLIYTPRESWAFKWYAERAEFFSYKDCPQDVSGILEWNDRKQFVTAWEADHRETGVTVQTMHELQHKTSVTHILSRRYEPFETQPVYFNDSYKLYAIPGTIDLQPVP